MAQVNTIQSRLDFLKEAAYLLAIPGPTTSAALGAARDKVLEEQEADLQVPKKEWNALRREVCGACGSLMIPGRTCEVKLQAHSDEVIKKIRNKQPAKLSSKPEKNIVYCCSICDRRTVQALPPRPSKHTKHLTRGLDVGNASLLRETSTKSASAIAKSANASSKQRKKSRKGGLQALLDRSKKETSSQLGLDLMDFMK